MKKVNRQAVYELLDSVIANESKDEQISILKDLIVDEFCFKGLAADVNLGNLEKEIQQEMTDHPNNKIMVIKKTREATGLGLKEAKDLVESLTPSHPSFGNNPSGIIMAQSSITEKYIRGLGQKLNQLAKDYGKPEPF